MYCKQHVKLDYLVMLCAKSVKIRPELVFNKIDKPINGYRCGYWNEAKILPTYVVFLCSWLSPLLHTRVGLFTEISSRWSHRERERERERERKRGLGQLLYWGMAGRKGELTKD